jgi:hypothetical protein
MRSAKSQAELGRYEAAREWIRAACAAMTAWALATTRREGTEHG